MIQSAINQLIGLAAAVKKANDVTAQKEAARISREEKARSTALKRAQDRIQAKWAQNKDYQAFLSSLGSNQAPEELKRIAYEAHKQQPQIRLGKERIDFSKLSPEAQEAIRRGTK